MNTRILSIVIPLIMAAVSFILAGCTIQPAPPASSAADTPAKSLPPAGTTVLPEPGSSSLPPLFQTPALAPSLPGPSPLPVSVSSGLYAIWYTNHPGILKLPYVSGGQIWVQWADVEVVEGQYDFSAIDGQLADFARSNLKTTLQVNGDRKPLWLFQKVPHNPDKLGVQVGNPQGTLMYWHLTFIRAYTDLLAALARHLKMSPYLSSVLGVRQNFNAIGTEQINVAPANRALSKWSVPAGASQGAEWTQSIADDYQRTILDAYVNDFNGWLYVFIRTTISDSLIAKYLPLIESGRLGWFQTGSEVEPRAQTGETSIARFYDYCLTGKTLGYAEPMADAWGYHGSTQDARWASPPQWNYWRLLDDLNAGVSVVAVYGDDLNVALNGKYIRDSNAAKYQTEFDQAFAFAAKYAGYIAQPQNSPGAWIAFRHSDVNNLQQKMMLQQGLANAARNAALTRYTDDYTFLITRLPDKTTSKTNVGPDDQRFGAWGRLLPAAEKMGIVLDDTFARSLEGKPSEVRVTYLDSSSGSFSVALNNQTYYTDLRGTGRWQTAAFPMPSTHLVKDSRGAQITLQSSGADIFFHMLEIAR
jgi:hypothetical protein